MSSAQPCSYDNCHLNQSHKAHEPSKWEKASDLAMMIFKRVCFLAISAYAAYLLPDYFMISAAAGLLIGLVVRYYQIKKVKEKMKCAEEARAGCSAETMEKLSGVKMPEPIAVAAGVTMMVCHVEHHSPYVVPIVGFSFGYFLGDLGARAIHSIESSCARPKSSLKPKIATTH